MSDATRKERRLKYGVSSAAAAVILAGILIAINIIGLRFFLRADLTQGKEFTISPSTKQILHRLDDLVTVKVYFSKKLPPQMATLRTEIEDILKEYEVYSKGKLQVRFLDPSSKPEIAQEAQALGIPELQMNVMEKDQYQVSNVFMGIGVLYGDKNQAIPVVQDVSTLEYDLTSAIVKLTRKDEKTIGFLTGHDEKDLSKDFQSVQQALSTEFRVRPVSLNGGRTPVPDDINCLVVAGPKNIGDREKYEIDQFIMKGGRAVFMVDPISLNTQAGLEAMPETSGLEDLLSSYGVGIRSAVVCDPRNSMASFQAGYIAYTTPYPLWPKVVGKDLDSRNPITSRLESITFPWTAPLEVKVAAAPGSGSTPTAPADSPQPKVQATVLARSTNKAWLQSRQYDLNPQSAQLQMGRPAGEMFPLAVALSGEFQSYYAGKPVPAAGPAAAEPGQAAPPAPADAPTVTSSPLTQIVVVGNSNFSDNTFLRMFPENLLFLQNALDWMNLGNDLIAIRSRGATERPIKELSAGARTAIKILLTFGVPALVVLFGLLRGVVRRKSREQSIQAYRPAH